MTNGKLQTEKWDLSNKLYGLNCMIASYKTILMDTTDPTLYHIESVSGYMRAMSSKLSESYEKMEICGIVGILHDYGKLPMAKWMQEQQKIKWNETDDRREYMMLHSRLGYRALSVAAAFLQEESGGMLSIIARACLEHHYDFDGGGYPYHENKGQAISDMARRLRICDSVDAMIFGGRMTWRTPLHLDAVKDELEKGRGSKYDPYYIDVMLSIL
jgi:putative two-component system response regulator